MNDNAENFRQECIARWEEYCVTGESVPNEAVMAWLDSWGTENELDPPRAKNL